MIKINKDFFDWGNIGFLLIILIELLLDMPICALMMLAAYIMIMRSPV